MRYDTAPCRLLIWLAAAVLGWAVTIGMVLHVPQALAVLAVAGVVLWRKGQRPLEAAAPTATRVRAREDVRALVAHSV